MQHRLGRCDACRASYQIPTEFHARFARCMLCRGLVRIGRAGGEEPWRPMPKPAAPAGLRQHELVPHARPALVAALHATPADLPRTTAPLAFEDGLDSAALALETVLDGAFGLAPESAVLGGWLRGAEAPAASLDA